MPLSVQVLRLKPARVSCPTTTAIFRIAPLSNVAAQEGPDGNEVLHRPACNTNAMYNTAIIGVVFINTQASTQRCATDAYGGGGSST